MNAVLTAPTLMQLRQLIREELLSQRSAELAVVQEQHPADPDNYACTVRLRDSGLVLSKVPISTPRLGAVAIPPVGALVLLQFIGGDVHAPVIVGTLYNDEDRPPANEDGQVLLNLPHDADPDDALTVSVKSAGDKLAQLKIGSAITVLAQDGDPVLSIDVGGNATVTIDSDGRITIESSRALNIKANEISIAADANIEIKAGAKLTLKGSVVNLN